MKLSKLFKFTAWSRYILAGLLLVAVNLFIFAPKGQAAVLTNTVVRLSRNKSGASANLRVIFKATGGATGFVVNMNGGDTGTAQWTNATPGGVVFNGSDTIANTTGCDAGAVTDNGGSRVATGATAGTITVTGLTALTNGSIYCYDITNGSNNVVTNPTAGHEGEYHPTVAETGGVTDSTTTSVDVISNDQISVTATVNPVFNLTACSTTDNFTTSLPTTGAPAQNTGCTVTVNTNALNGWFLWANDLNTGLKSTSNGLTIASTTPGTQASISGTNNANNYIFSVTAKATGGACATTCGTVSAITAYDDTAGNGGIGSGLNTTPANFAKSTGPNNAATVTFKSRAKVDPTQPAASDYTDTITIIGAGYF